MRIALRKLSLFTVLSAFCCALTAMGQLSAIRRTSLPQTPAVLNALDDLVELEPYSAAWTPEWKYNIGKDEVAARLSKDLGILCLVVKQYPDNLELSLLAGVTARYAYNVDVDGTFDAATAAFEHAAKLNPTDLRPPWFEGAFLCSTATPEPGAELLLGLEASHKRDALPAGFWEDYMFCMHVVSMPVHVLRAAKYLQDMGAPDSPMRDFLVGVEKKRFEPVDKDKVYDEGETWSSGPIGKDVLYANTGCGLGIELKPDWKPNSLRLAKGDCKAEIDVGPYGRDKTTGSVLIFAEWPRAGETLHDFLNKYGMKGYESATTSTVSCPIAGCLTMSVVTTAQESKQETALNYVVLFERQEPDFPGLALEVPNPPQPNKESAGPVYFHPDQLEQRVPGKMFYAVIFTIDREDETEGQKDFQFLLEKLRVD